MVGSMALGTIRKFLGGYQEVHNYKQEPGTWLMKEVYGVRPYIQSLRLVYNHPSTQSSLLERVSPSTSSPAS